MKRSEIRVSSTNHHLSYASLEYAALLPGYKSVFNFETGLSKPFFVR
jgi:hypothetical protein